MFNCGKNQKKNEIVVVISDKDTITQRNAMHYIITKGQSLKENTN